MEHRNPFSLGGDPDEVVFLGGSPILESSSRKRGGAAFLSMGLAAGGEIEQQIFRDPYGLDAWDPSDAATGRLWIHLVNSEGWTTITGEAPPSTPITRQKYVYAGYPWFEYYDEKAVTANRPSRLEDAPGLAEIDQSHGFKTDAAAPSPGGKTVVLDPNDPQHVIGIKPSNDLPKAEIKDGVDQGKWPGKKGQ
jgi:hypothetical protein